MARADGQNPDVRVSDAERDAVASEIGQHFQDGRLDQAEFDERVTAALAARTQRDLDELFTDLPRDRAGQQGWAAGEPERSGAPEAAWRSSSPGRRRGWPRVPALLPLLVAAIVIGGSLAGGWRHGWPFAPFGFLWLIIAILVVRNWVRGGRRRQWR